MTINILHVAEFMTIKFSVSLCESDLLNAITLDNKFQTIFCICDEYVINLFVCIYEVRKWT